MKHIPNYFIIIIIATLLSACATTVNVNADNSYAVGTIPKVINVWAYTHNSNVLNTITNAPLGQNGHYNKNYYVKFPYLNQNKNYYIMISITERTPNFLSNTIPQTAYWCSKNRYNFSNKAISIAIPNARNLYPTWKACW